MNIFKFLHRPTVADIAPSIVSDALKNRVKLATDVTFQRALSPTDGPAIAQVGCEIIYAASYVLDLQVTKLYEPDRRSSIIDAVIPLALTSYVDTVFTNTTPSAVLDSEKRRIIAEHNERINSYARCVNGWGKNPGKGTIQFAFAYFVWRIGKPNPHMGSGCLGDILSGIRNPTKDEFTGNFPAFDLVHVPTKLLFDLLQKQTVLLQSLN